MVVVSALLFAVSIFAAGPADRILQLGGRLGRLGGVCAKHLKRVGITRRKEPFAATIGMAPAFKMHALGVFAGEHIGFEFFRAGAGAVAFQMRLVTGGEFGLAGLHAAIRALKGQHDWASCLLERRGPCPRTPGIFLTK